MEHYGHKLVSGPASEPVTAAEAKAYCRVDGYEEDDLFSNWITECRMLAERITGRSLIVTTWRLTLDAFPADGVIRPLRSPLVAVSQITYVDVDGNTQTLSSSLYQVDAKSEPGRIYPVPGSVWPVTQCDRLGAVNVTYTAGEGITAADFALFKGRILTALAHCWRLRESRDQDWLERLFGSLETCSY